MNLAFYMRMYKKLKDGDINDQDCKDIFQDEYIRFQIFCKREKEFEDSLYVLEKKNVEISGSVYYVTIRNLMESILKMNQSALIKTFQKLEIDLSISEEDISRIIKDGPKDYMDVNRFGMLLSSYKSLYGVDITYRGLMAQWRKAQYQYISKAKELYKKEITPLNITPVARPEDLIWEDQDGK